MENLEKIWEVNSLDEGEKAQELIDAIIEKASTNQRYLMGLLKLLLLRLKNTEDLLKHLTMPMVSELDERVTAIEG